MPYSKDEMLEDFRKDVASLTAENAQLRAAVEQLRAACKAADNAIGEWLYDSRPSEFNPSDSLDALRSALSATSHLAAKGEADAK